MKKLIIYTDGASKGNPGAMTVGIVFQVEKEIIRKITKKIGHGTNNQSEYNAVVIALDLAKKMGYSDVELRSDSQLLINQLNGEYAVKSNNIIPLYLKVKDLTTNFKSIIFKWVPRTENKLADALSNE
tara:strand:- start:1470 stop:1853 length:384 start_codon:yes stop_codon:yes gene_type:complete